MQTADAFPETLDESAAHRFSIGRAYVLYLPKGPRRKGHVYYRGELLKEVDFGVKSERQRLVIELMEQRVNQTKLAEALRVSRQTLHNYRESYKNFGLEGLVHGYQPSESKSLEAQRKAHAHKRRGGTKARQLEQLRKQQREALPKNGALDLDPPSEALQKTLQDTESQASEANSLTQEELPFAANHLGCASRYAGALILLFPLLVHWRWFDKILPRFGRHWRIFRQSFC
jgi:hypothetical protein